MGMRAGELIAERFALERIAGTGGMGTVYRARDQTGGAPVALKVLSAHDTLRAERFAREARILAQLSHPGIVRYISHGTTFHGEMYLVMEWLEGEDLAQRLQRAPLTVEESLALVTRVADALAAAHSAGVIHRDLKPSNLFLADGDIARVKLLDFGVARISGGMHGVREQTLTAGRVGTPRYMSPEQARGEKEIDARADIFSLGCVFYACLTGRAAFLGDDEIGVLAKILLEDPPRPREVRPGIPRPLDDLCMRMLSKDPAKRPQDAASIVAEISSLGTLVMGERSLPGEPDAALGEREQRLLCVVLAPKPPRSDESDAVTRPVSRMDTDEIELREAIARHGAHMEPLHDGGFVVTLTGSGSATDQAAQAARCALAIRERKTRATMALATGRGVLAHRLPVGDVIDRAVVLLRGAPGRTDEGELGPIRIDELTAGLLGQSFDVRGDGAGLLLYGERDVQEGGRTLLGRPSPCVGRERELSVLMGLYEECVAERVARAVLVTAAAGVGKSRLRQEFLQLIEARGSVEAWIGRGDPLRAGSPFGMLASPIRRAAGLQVGEPASVSQKKLRARLSRNLEPAEIPRVSEFLGELLGIPFSDEGSVQLRAARSDAMLMGDQMRRAFEDWLGAECAAQPMVLVLEDLQWGDSPSVAFIDTALRNLRDRPLLVLALGRPEVTDVFPDIWGKRALTRMHLGEITTRACEKLVRDVLGDAVSREQMAQIVRRAGGNALYLEELIRSVAEGRPDELPETILAMVQARLERLPPEARRVLRAASVFGEVFWKGGIIALAGGPRRASGVDEWLTELALREVITKRRETRFPGEIEYAFRHALVREAAYASLTDKDKQLAHRIAGEWLVQVGEVDALVLAEHTERGGEPYHAVGYYRRAAEQALEGNDFASALLRADRGVACGATGATLGALRRLQAEAHRWRGENSAAEFRGLEAMRCTTRGSGLWFEAVGEVAIAAGRRGNHKRMNDLVDTLRRMEVPRPPPPARVAVLARLTIETLLAGHVDQAKTLLAEAEAGEAALVAPAPSASALVHAARAHVARQGGDLVTFVRQTEAAVARFREAGALRTASLSLANLGLVYAELGAFERAESLLRDTLATSERMGLAHITAIAKHNLGLVLARLGRLDEARRVEEEAAALSHAQGNRRFEGGARTYLAVILMQAGDLDAAEKQARAALDILAAAPLLRPIAAAALSEILLRQRRPREALDEMREVVGALDTGGVEEGEAYIRLVHAEVLHANGDLDGARRAITAARDLLYRQAELLGDATLRAGFLTRVDEHVRILERARTWLDGVSPIIG
jgi:tetratricopeptide (TPR) repeat protein